jgi:MYXO-CTERM domain-containing protein
MKGILAVSLVLGSSGIALAETQSVPQQLGQPAAPLRTYKMVDPSVPVYKGFENVQAAPGFSNVIYLNNCKAGGGCTIKAGYDNSLTNTSSIPNSTANVSPFAYSDSIWQQVVQCVRETYAPFGVVITDQRPTSGNYHMAIVAGLPQQVGMQSGVGGVSPFGCGYLPNAVSFSFSNVYGPNVDDICWTVAQETAHSWGLDHKFDNRDPMTYLQSGPSRKKFINESGRCGEFSARNCQCGGSNMNSFADIMDTFGSSTPTPPTVKFTAPANGATNLDPEFPIRAEITDDIGVIKAELRIDGQLVSTLEKPPWVWNAPKTLGQGNHILEVTGYDVGGTPAKAMINAAIGAPCGGSDDCDGTDVCVDGRCVPGGGVEGGLGTTCQGNNDCFSNQCAMDASGGSYCVESCDPTRDACPGGFTCIDAGGGSGVCWPGGDEGICSVGGSHNNGRIAPTFLLLGLVALFITRRRRR